MLFITNESIMNGTVTMENIINGIEAETFDEAKTILKNRYKYLGFEVKYGINNNDMIIWTIDNDEGLPTYGRMENKELFILRNEDNKEEAVEKTKEELAIEALKDYGGNTGQR